MDSEHGFDTPEGYHVGDLPNIYVSGDGTAKADFFSPRLTLTKNATGMAEEGPFPLLDDDGSAIMIHENPDNYKAIPPDSTGARIACGVIGEAASK